MTIREIVPPDTSLAFPALAALRAHLKSKPEFVQLVDSVQRPEGYRLVGAFDPEWPHAAAVAGFRVGHTLAWGRFLYVDDLSTAPAARRRGHGRALLEWVFAEAARLGCDEVHLDSGVGPDRTDAHRLYFNAGLRISSHHFGRSLLP